MDVSGLCSPNALLPPFHRLTYFADWLDVYTAFVAARRVFTAIDPAVNATCRAKGRPK